MTEAKRRKKQRERVKTEVRGELYLVNVAHLKRWNKEINPIDKKKAKKSIKEKSQKRQMVSGTRCPQVSVCQMWRLR